MLNSSIVSYSIVFYRTLESISIASALSTALWLLPFIHARSKSISTDSLNSQLLTERVVAGNSGQFTPDGYLSTVKHTVLAGIEPITQV